MPKKIKYHPEVDKLEHDDSTAPETKRVLVYGWDANSLQKTRLATDSSGNLQVDIVSGGGSGGGTSAVDDAAFTAATDSGTPMMGFVTSDTVDTGDVGVVAMDTNRNLKVIAQSNSGVDIGDVTINNSTGASAVNIQDGGNSITVDAPVGTPAFVRLSDGASAISTLPVSLASVPSHAVTNAGTFATQVDGAALTALQLIDDVVYTDDTSTHATGTSKGALIMAAATPTDGSVNANDIGAVAMTTDRKLHVSVQDALPAGTNAIGKLASNTGVTIGAVEIASAQTLGTVTTLTGGGVAHDSADSGNPHKVGYIAYSPDGTTPGTAVAELDRTNAKADLDGRHLVNDEHPRWWSYHLNTSTAQTDASVQADPGDGFQIVITDIQFSNGSATAINMFLEEDSTTIWGPVYLEAINGRGYVWKGKKHVTASTALTITTSSSTAHSVEILGYIQAV